jgi:outer membrane protein assembly factor BamB
MIAWSAAAMRKEADRYASARTALLALSVASSVWVTGVIVPPNASGQQLVARHHSPTGSVGTATVDWPRYGFDQSNASDNPFETTLSASNVSSLVVKWAAPDHGPKPVLAGGLVYASTKHGLGAFDAATGARLWTSRFAAQESGAADVSGGVAYAASHCCHLAALDASTGTLLWRGFTGTFNDLDSPLVVDGVVVLGDTSGLVSAFPVGCSNPCSPSWTVQLSNDVLGAPAAEGGTIYVTTGNISNGQLVAIDAASGSVLWKTPLAGADPYGPVVVGNVIYVGAGFELEAFSTSCMTGCSPLWAVPTSRRGHSSPETSPAVGEGVAVMVTKNSTIGFDAATGRTLWSVSAGASDGGPPAIANGVVYLFYGDGTLRAFDVHTGDPLATIPLASGPPTPGSAIVANGTVYVATQAPGLATLFALSLPG